MIGFILPNKKGTKDLKEYAVTVDEIENLTGIDFFNKMISKSKEEKLENNCTTNLWNFTIQKY